jgi:hypothetical protein
VGSHDARLEAVAGPRPVPVRGTAAALDIDAPVVAAPVRDGELVIPDDAVTAAWYRAGPAPGDPGSAVLAAHVDYAGQLGAFFHLEDAEPDQRVDVHFDDGSRRAFRVVARQQFPRDTLTSLDLFARDGPAVLTLVTCGGTFDSSAHHYRDNVVVRAVPVGSTP